jgi:ATP-binding cassette subfamily B protein
MVVRHQISVGEFVAFNTYLMQLTWPMIALGWVVNLFQRGTASVMRIHELLIAQPTIDDVRADAALAGVRLRGDIEFRALGLSYGNTRVLQDVNLHVPAGTSLAIVGPTGSG